ncbi:SAV_2336 N-terminal domain-related protein [Streptomyces sp. NPDC059828]|uniref:SAV_2336 N-terminal domain-related protein n=1 Tax=Streptomyces sp. NPDC059828 TaxID=3346965 RepID=UPI00364C3DD8
MISRLAELLRLLGEDPEAEQLADVLWLAEHIGPPTATYGPNETAPSAPAVTAPPPPTADARPWDLTEPEPPVTAPGAERDRLRPGGTMMLYVPEARPAQGDVGGERIRLRAPAALPRRAALARSLRPLTRRVPSRTETVLDEEATVEGIVDTAQWSPVLRPAPSRWLDLVLVVDDSMSMMVWRDTIREFLSVLSSVGAFRSVQHWLLPTEEIPHHGIVLRPPATGQGDRHTDRSPLEIVDPTGRRVVLVASDCVSPSWADGTLGRLLRTWGQSGPVALVHLLPRRMWKQSALSFHNVRLGSDMPGAPNARLAVTPLGSHRPTPRTMAVPVLELDPRWLGPWAALVSGETSAWDTVATLVPESLAMARPPVPPAPAVPKTESPQQLVHSFRKRASPQAMRLASHLAAVPLSLPVMRLVQRAVCGDTRPSVLTEVLFTGLVIRAGQDATDAAGSDPHEVLPVLFDFRPGVRDVLLGMARRTQVLQTLSLVTEWLFDRLQRSGTPTTDFAAMLGREASAVHAARSVRPFATVTAQTLRHLSGEYEALAQHLEEAVPSTMSSAASTITGPATADTGTCSVLGIMPPVGALLDRDKLLAEVHEGAFNGRGTGLVLTAREGGGATAAAARYVALYGHTYDHVAWVTAGRPTTGPELPALLRTATGQDTARWLLVVDRARPEDLPTPGPDGPGTLLITSVDDDWPSEFVRHAVPPFKRATSIRFLRDRVRDLTPSVALRIAARLDDVPRALTIAAALLSRIAPDVLLTALGADPAPGAQPAAPLDDPVAEVCVLAQDLAVRECPAAEQLLDLCAVLAGGPVPTGFFSRALPRTYRSALAALGDTELVTGTADGTTVFVAPVVGRVRRERMDAAEVNTAQRLARATFITWHAAVSPSTSTAADLDGVLGLTRHLEPMGALGDDDPAVREAVRDQVLLLADRGDTAGAIAWGTVALKRLEAQAGADDPAIAELALVVSRLTSDSAKSEEPQRP